MTWTNKIRIGWGLGFLVSAGFNLIFGLRNQEYIWEFFLENVQLPIYKDILENIIIPNGSIIIVLTVIFEVVTGVLILNKLLLARLGLVFASLWPIFLLPLEWSEMARNILLAIVPALLLLRKYETTFLEMLREIGRIVVMEYQGI
ncbi:MAG: hypothetical protein ACXADA_15295 [Candidatus Hodarchaeales archaeon]|jgi:hypothetical protein